MKSLALASALALSLTAFAQTPNIDISYKKFVLNNGLTLLVHEDHKAPIVAVNVWYHVGSKNELPGKTGFAHLFEHLMFGGSENVKMRYINAVEKIGATDLNGTTNNDRTNYFETVPASAVDYTLFLESDRMGHLLKSFDAKTLELQRGVVQNEKRQGENQPYGMAYELITKATYPAGHPYSWSVIGSMEDLNAASLEDVSNWFKSNYGPSNAVLVLAGDITPETARQKVEKYFGDLPPGPPVAHHEAWVAKMTGEHRQRLQDRVPQARIYKVWNVPQYGAPDEAYLDLVSDVLSQGKSSRLYKRLVYDDQIATSARAFLDSNEIGGQFLMQLTARSGESLAKVEKAGDEELARFIKDGPTPQELERVKAEYMAHFVRGLERVGGFGGKSDVLAINEVYLHNPDAYKLKLKRVADARPEDLQAAAKRWLSDGDYALEVVPFPQFKNATAGVDRSKFPDPGTPPDAKMPHIERATLSNGLKVMLAQRHELPLVEFRMLVNAGYAADQFATPGTSRLTMTLLPSGTKTRNALQISDELGALGADARANSTLDSSIVSLSAMKNKIDPSLGIFADMILNPTFPESEVAREKKQLLAAIEQEKVSPNGMAMRVLPTLIYGKDHAYGHPLSGSGTPQGVAGITRADLAKFHQTWFHPNNATLIVVGDTTLQEIVPKLEAQFSGWKAAEVPKKNLSKVALPAKAAVYLLDRPGAMQSMLMAGEVAPPKNNPQEIALGVLNDMIGGTFSGRLNMNLREDKHWSYGAFSMFMGAQGQSPFLSIAPVQTDKTKESLAEMSRELHEIVGAKPVTNEELERARTSRILELPGSKETMSSVAQSMINITSFGFPDNYYDTYTGKVKALKSSDIADAAKSVVQPDKLIWVVVGDRSKIEQGVRDLNLGEIHLIDADGNPIG